MEVNHGMAATWGIQSSYLLTLHCVLELGYCGW